jgi:hypothetical protein
MVFVCGRSHLPENHLPSRKRSARIIYSTTNRRRDAFWWSALVAVCLGSRGAATITYIEDPDSLRFALSVAEGYDVAALQPHFPGYPVFWFLSKGFFLVTGHFSVAFSLVGGVATVGIVWSLLRLRGARLRSTDGAALVGTVVLNPFLWLMGTRYMPDLLGAAGALGTLAVLLRALTARDERAALAGMAGAGLLAGLRLSHLPLVLPLAAAVLWRGPRRRAALAAGAAGVLVWLVPMTLDTGFGPLVAVAREQTAGHFADFGGTVQTEPDLLRRLKRLAESLWAGGLGAWWPGRHPLTAVVGLGAATCGAAGAVQCWSEGPRRRFWWIAGGAATYLLWAFFFQNIIHKTRHVLPLLALLLVLPASGAAALWRRGGRWGRGSGVAFAAAYAAVALVLVVQHRQPTAIAQVKTFVEKQQQAAPGALRVASIPLVNAYLRRQQVEARYFSVTDSADVRRLRRASERANEEARTLVVGTHPALLPAKPPRRVRTFYHNPYVNPMWPEVHVRVYD